jgi:hypothetical protein
MRLVQGDGLESPEGVQPWKVFVIGLLAGVLVARMLDPRVRVVRFAEIPDVEAP